MNPGAFSKRSLARSPHLHAPAGLERPRNPFFVLTQQRQPVGVCTGMEAQTYICATCGVQFAPGANEPGHCPICQDERQYVGWSRQRWTTLSDLRKTQRNQMRDERDQIGMRNDPRLA